MAGSHGILEYMTRFGWAVLLGVIGVLIVIGGFIIWRHSARQTAITNMQATTTPSVNPATLSIYTNGEFGFSLFYPSAAHLTDAYSTTTLSGIDWRVGATGSGTPVVRIQEGNEEVRVGMSTDQRELKVCTQVGPAETLVGPFTIGSTTWQETTFQKIGTDNEQQITSYRIMHDHACYALELFEPLNGTASSTGYTLKDTITSFSFAK